MHVEGCSIVSIHIGLLAMVAIGIEVKQTREHGKISLAIADGMGSTCAN